MNNQMYNSQKKQTNKKIKIAEVPIIRSNCTIPHPCLKFKSGSADKSYCSHFISSQHHQLHYSSQHVVLYSYLSQQIQPSYYLPPHPHTENLAQNCI